MTRNEAKQNLINLGIEEPTDEQISNYLNTVNGAIKVEKDKAESLVGEKNRADDLQKQLEELQNQNLTEVEKVTKQNEALAKQLSELKFAKCLSDNNITGESADTFMKAFAEGNFESMASIIGEIAKTSRAEGETAMEQKIASGEYQIQGGGKDDDGKDDDKSSAETIADSVVKSLVGDSGKSSADIVSNYTL